ncbi:MAG: hypothetical protein O3A46_05695, partial [Candidatus Poribacteria bacterium]|nr:hypothetical protein [Candidatus Poribacteria bacterium]
MLVFHEMETSPTRWKRVRLSEDWRDAVARAKGDPVAFAEQTLGVDLWSRQKDVLRSVFENRRTVVPAGHGVGKTFVSAVAALTFLFLRQPSKVITTAPTWNQVRKLLWAEINALFKRELRPHEFPGTANLTELRIQDDWFAVGLSAVDTESFQGHHQEHLLIILDEAPGVRHEIYVGADSLMSAGDAHMLMIGNPVSQQGHFYDACRTEGWNVLTIACPDSPNFTGENVSDKLRKRLVTKEWVDEKKREWGTDSPQYKSRVLGEFPASGSDQLIPLEWVNRAIKRYEASQGDMVREGETLMGVDVARFGSDATVYMILRGCRYEFHVDDRQRDVEEIAGHALWLQGLHGVERIGVDDIGVGGGVTDLLR